MATLAPASSGVAMTSFTAPTIDAEDQIELRWGGDDHLQRLTPAGQSDVGQATGALN